MALKLGERNIRTPLDSTASIIPERQTTLVAKELYCRHTTAWQTMPSSLQQYTREMKWWEAKAEELKQTGIR